MAKKKKLTALQQGGILYSRNREAGTTVVKKCPGRKSIFDTPALEELKKLVIQDTNHCRLNAREIQELWNKEKNQTVSISTIRRALKKTGLHHLHWSTHQWRNIIWSDESFFRQFSSSHNIRVWRTPAEEFDESCLVPTVGRSPGRMFWGCFSWHGLGPIIPIHGFPNRKSIFQQDNAPSHKSKKAMDFFDNAGISMLPWPPQSLDLNPLENLWQEIESHLRSSLDKPTSIKDLEEKVKATWNSIPPRYYRGLVNSMPNR
ncbi:33755_t:CDS:2, partial [Racocetra persica]